MKTRLEMAIEIGAMRDNDLKKLIEDLNFNKRETIEEERMLEIAKLEVVRRFLGEDKYYIDEYSLLRKKVETDEMGYPLVNGVKQILIW